NNTGGGTMTYSASVTSGSSWLSIGSGGSGGDSGIIVLNYAVNGTSVQRTGSVQVTASGATGSPITVTITQAASGGSGTVFRFPLNGYTPYTAPVASVFDHSGSTYIANNEVIAYTGERGIVRDNVEPPVVSGGQSLYSYKKS